MYFLRHYFDPDFNYTALKPKPGVDGKADLRNLGYVQNVSKGDVLAELVSLEGADEAFVEASLKRPEFTCHEAVLPAGPNTVLEEKNGLPVLKAAVDGYVFYFEGKITVKSLLNVRGNVDFRTGNINFLGDVHVHGEVATGFVIRGRNVLLDGSVDGSIVLAKGDLAIAHGARGAGRTACFLQAKGSIRLGFADKIELSSGNNTTIQRAVLHSHLFVGRRLAVGGLLSGGDCQVWHSMVVSGDVGTMGGTSARITLGFDPWLTRAVANATQRLEEASKRLALLQPHMKDPLSLPVPDLKRDLSEAAKEQDGLFTHKIKRYRLWTHVLQKQLEYLEKERLASCLDRSPGLYVAGTIYPGTEINICGVKLVVRDAMTAVRLEKEGNSIVTLPLGNVPDSETGMVGLV